MITAGAAQKPGETRVELLRRNVGIFDSILGEVLKYNSDGILLIATNPVDIMSYFSWKKSGWPSRRVIGSGTLLDSARFRYLIGQHLNIDPRSVHAHIVGEHGDSEVPLWSITNIAGTGLLLQDEVKEDIFANTRDAAYQIINAKGATYYAIALALDRICTAILKDEGAVLNVSSLLTGYLGISDVYLGVPAIVDRSGIRETLKPDITAEETRQLQRSADNLKQLIQSVASE